MVIEIFHDLNWMKLYVISSRRNYMIKYIILLLSVLTLAVSVIDLLI